MMPELRSEYSRHCLEMGKKVFGNKKIVKRITCIMVIVFGVLHIIVKKSKLESVYEDQPEQKNPLEGKNVVFIENTMEKENADGMRGHLDVTGVSEYSPSWYEKYAKRVIDILLSFGGLVILSPLMGLIALVIKAEDPGTVLFTQKRIGQNKQYFELHKFRSMKMDASHDIPTHMLNNPEQYLTKTGRFLRKYSLDELPQLWDIFIGNMSVVGPRPALWNQDVLISERDKYHANNVKPGLTGLAQINGRDKLEIPDKAKLDGIYCQNIGLIMDMKVFFGSFRMII